VWVMIDFGKYDQRVKFKNFQRVPNGSGGYTPVWVTLIETFARIIQVGSKRDQEQMQLGLPETLRIGIQYRESYEPSVKDVVEFRGKDYSIKAIVVGDLRQTREYVIDAVRANED